jgi:hypothetical protein
MTKVACVWVPVHDEKGTKEPHIKTWDTLLYMVETSKMPCVWFLVHNDEGTQGTRNQNLEHYLLHGLTWNTTYYMV